MELVFDTSSVDSYKTFLKVKSLPIYKIQGHTAWFPDEYAERLGLTATANQPAKYRHSKHLFDYQRDITDLAIRKRKYAAFMDCVAKGTVVDTEHGPVAIEDIKKPVRIWCCDNNGKLRLEWASRSWINGYNSIFEYVCKSGRRISATHRHRFMTSDGWKRGDELKIGEHLLVCDVSHLQSTSVSVQPTHFEGDLNFSRKVQGSKYRCSAYSHHDDELLLLKANTDVSPIPLPVDVLEHIQQHWQTDDLACESKYIRRYQFGDRPSMHHYGHPVVTTEASGEYLPQSCDYKYTAENSRTFQPTGEDTIPVQSECESHPMEDEQIVAEPFEFSYDTLVAIHYIGDDTFYDIEVQTFHNYIANGFVSHNCGLGKTLIMLEFAKYVGDAVLIVSPLMVVKQTMAECERFYGKKLKLAQVRAHDLQDWLSNPKGIAITNYEAITDELESSKLKALILDESSLLKSHYGKWGTKLIQMGRGVDYKLSLTGTPAPNDRIEYANQAVFLDASRTVNEFLARYFVNRGQTNERWELKPHALKPFYRSISHWCIFVSNPGAYGWKDNADPLPPINVHIHEVGLTDQQNAAVRETTQMLFARCAGGITSRSKLARIAKGSHNGERIMTKKLDFIRDLIATWSDESTLVWCRYNQEQDDIADHLPGCLSMSGDTPYDDREEMIRQFKSREKRILASKSKILGFGLNLQVATRHVFSTCQDSYEEFYQCVKRSNRYGATHPLNVHIPVTDLEIPMMDNVLRKAHRVAVDAAEQEKIFVECRTEEV